LTKILERTRQWMNEDRLPRVVKDNIPTGRRPLGRPQRDGETAGSPPHREKISEQRAFYKWKKKKKKKTTSFLIYHLYKNCSIKGLNISFQPDNKSTIHAKVILDKNIF